MLMIIAVIVALLAGGFFLYANSQPDNFRIARSVVIEAPPEKILPLIEDLHAFNRWNPFLKLDPNTAITYSGPQRGRGAAHAWVGNAQVGKGSIEITDVLPPSQVLMKLDIIKPMRAQNRVAFTLVPIGNGTVVTWTMTGQNSVAGKMAGSIMDMDKMVGGSFEKGLAELKTIAETV